MTQALKHLFNLIIQTTQNITKNAFLTYFRYFIYSEHKLITKKILGTKKIMKYSPCMIQDFVDMWYKEPHSRFYPPGMNFYIIL